MKKLRMTTIKRKGRQLGQLALMLLMVLSLFLANVPAAMAEGDSSSPASGSPGQTASLTATEGTATLSEVIDENNSNTQSSAENFTNDLPSVTVTETFVTTDTSDKTPEEKIESLTPKTTTYTLTETGATVAKNDESKVDKTNGDVTVTASEPVAPPADPETGVTPAPEVTISRVTVIKSDNAIQKAVNSALEKITADTKSVTVTVGAGTYNGDVNIAATESLAAIFENNQDFTLYILGEGSYDKPADGEIIDKDTVGAQGGTDVILKGSINIDGINVTLAGIYLSMGNKLNVTGGSDVTVFGTTGRDGVDAVLRGEGNSLTVDTGAGNDTLTVTASGDYAGLNTVKADTGAGDDTVTLTQETGVMSVEIDTGDGDDKVTLSATSGASRSWSDTEGTEHKGSLTLNTGKGDDSVSASAALDHGYESITVNGGEGYDVMDLVGELKADDADAISGDLTRSDDGYSGTVTMKAAESDKTFDLELTAFKILTDSLKNKTSTELDDLNTTEISSFKNYTYKYNGTPPDGVSADWSDESVYGALVLTNLVIRGDEVKLGNLKLPTVNLTVESPDITVSGAVSAATIILRAHDEDSGYDLHGSTAGSIISYGLGDEALTGQMFDIVSNAKITVEEDAALDAVEGALTISASVDQTANLIDLLGTDTDTDWMNFFNVKVGDALVKIFGDLTAKTDVIVSAKANVTMEVSNSVLSTLYVPVSFAVSATEASVEVVGSNINAGGDVKLSSESSISAKASATTGDLPVSLAVAVVVNDAHTILGGDSTVKAGGDVTISSKANTVADANAGRGTLNKDASGYITVEVAVQDCYARVTDTASIEAGGSVSVTSTSNLKGSSVATSAAKAGGQAGQGGKSVDDALDKAKGLLMKIIGKLEENELVRAVYRLTDAADYVGGQTYKITVASTENGSVSAPGSANGFKAVSDATFKDGVQYYQRFDGKYVPADVTVGAAIPVTKSYFTAADPVKLVVNPAEGYTLDDIVITYLPPDADEKSTVKLSQSGNALSLQKCGAHTYSFNMPDADITVTVTFKSGTDEDAGAAAEEGSSTEAGLTDIFSAATTGSESTQEDEEAASADGVQLRVGYFDTYTPIPGTPNGEFYEKLSDGTYSLVTGTPVSGKTYYSRSSAFALTEDNLFREGTRYYTRNADGTYTAASVTAGGSITPGTYYVRCGSITPSVSKADAASTVTIKASPIAQHALSGVTASYKTNYLLTTDSKFQSSTTYYLFQDGEFKEQSVTAGENIPADKAYYIKSSESRTVTELVNPDKTGAYTYKVPAGVTAEGILFNASFSKGSTMASQAKKSDNNATSQYTGALACGVNINRNDASVTTSGTITAGSSVTIKADGKDIATVKADGTAVGADKPNEDEAEGTHTDVTTAKQTVVPYTVYLEPSQGASLKAVADGDAETGVYVFEIVSDAADYKPEAGKVTFTYTDAEGNAKNGTAEFDSETGRYTVKLSGLSVKPGTKVSIKLEGATDGDKTEGKYLVSNPISVDETTNGSVTLAGGEAGSNVYLFRVKAAVGYAVKTGSPYITYTSSVTGETVKKALPSAAGSGVYSLKLASYSDLAAGSAVTIGAEFEENQKTVTTVTQAAGHASSSAGSFADMHGTTGSPAKAKVGEKVTFKINVAPGHEAQSVMVTLRYRLNGAEEDSVRILTADSDGKFNFIMPNANVTLIADFFNQIHTAQISGSGAGDAKVNLSTAGVGETVTVSLNDTAQMEGKKITAVSVSVKNKTTNALIATVNLEKGEDGKWSYLIPDELEGVALGDTACVFTFDPSFAEKTFVVKTGAVENGTIKLSSAMADPGETYTFTVTPNSGFELREGSVSVTITVGGTTTSLPVKGSGTKYSVVMPSDLTSSAKAEIRASFDIGLSDTTGSGKDGEEIFAMGASVSVAVTRHHNTARLDNATVNCKSLTVGSNTETTAKVDAVAGYNKADFGLGGAIAVQVGSVRSQALVDENAKLNLQGGKLSVTADSKNQFETTANARGTAHSKFAGVGAGIAVSATGVETIARVADGVVIETGDKALISVDVKATAGDTQKVNATAGSAGGISVTPALATLVAGALTHATLGKGTGTLKCSGDVNIGATSTLDRIVNADAASAGGGVGVGSTVGVSVLHDSTVARLSRSVTAKNVSVRTSASNREHTTAKAGTNGASGDSKSGDKDGSDPAGGKNGTKSGADKQADKALSGAGKLAGQVKTADINSDKLANDAKNKPSASTAEGGIEIAAALALNIQTTEALARIDDDITITAEAEKSDETETAASEGAKPETKDKGGKVTIQSLAVNESSVTANASAAKSNVGVGVAVALNQVTYSNEAILGDAAVKAVDLTVEAGIIPNGTKDKTLGKNDKYDPEKDRNWLMNLLEDAITDLVMDIADSMGLADLLGESNAAIISRIVTDMVDAALKELVEGTGLEDLLKNDPYEQLKDNLSALKDMFVDSIPDDWKEKLGLDEDADLSDLLDSELGDYLKDEGWNQVQDKLLDKFLDAVNPSMLNFLDPSSILSGTESFLEQIKNAFNVEDGFFSNTFDKLVDDLKDKIKELTGKDDLSWDSLSDWLEESFDNLVEKSVDQLTEGIVDLDKLKAFIADRVGEVLLEKLENAVEEAGKALTNAAVDEILGHLNREYIIEGEIDAHRFTTQAIAGSSGVKASVAGSAAIALISGTTGALIAGAAAPSDNKVETSGDMILRAIGSQVEKTTASAAEDGRGNADGNLNAGTSDKVDDSAAETKASTIDTISNAAIEVGAGGSASVSDRKVTLKPDSNKKVRGVTVKYVKPDGTTGSMDIPLSDGAFTVPEISKSGNSVTITLGDKQVEVKAGSKLTYRVLFVGKETAFTGDVDVSWKGDGSATVTKEDAGSETVDYCVKVEPKKGYILDKTLTFEYIKPDGHTDKVTVELTDAQLEELINNGYHFQIKRHGEDTTLILGAIKDIKTETIVNVSLRFIGKYVLEIEDAETAETPKPNADGSYSNSYVLKDGSKEAVKVKLMNLRAQKDGEELHAAASDRIVMIVKAAEGYSIDKMKLSFKVEGEDRSRDVVTVEPSVIDPDGGTAYVFTMPSSNAKLLFTFSESTEGEKEDEEKTQAGKKIGVGAGFAMTYTDLTVVAGIGDNRTVTAGTADISAKAVHNTQSAAVAGTDPLANTTGETNKNTALDASAAVSVIDDEIKATVGEGSTLTLSGKNTIVNADDPKSPLNFRLLAEREGKAITKASAFAAGKKTAIGASVSVNISSSDVLALLEGSVSAAGAAALYADDYSRDNSEALASAMGADLDRYLSKFAQGTESVEKKTNKLLAGKYFDDDETSGEDKKEETENGAKINDTLEEKGGKTTDGKANLSSNALRSQDVKSPSGEGASDKAGEGIDASNAESGENLDGVKANAEQKFQVAASVGLNITEHRAKITVRGGLSAASIAARADNRGNLMTKASGLAMSMEQDSNSIAAGVAVVVERNESTIDIYGDLTAKNAEGKAGELSLDASTTKNMDGSYRGLLAGQALSGAVAGGTVSVSGSVTVLTDDSVTAVRIHSTASKPITVEGGAIRFQAYDKTKLAIRAGGVGVSAGGNAGAGAAFAILYANSVVDASVGEKAVIRGSSLDICAEKAVVDYSDFENVVGVDTFLTDTSEVAAADKDKVDKGIINLDRDKCAGSRRRHERADLHQLLSRSCRRRHRRQSRRGIRCRGCGQHRHAVLRQQGHGHAGSGRHRRAQRPELRALPRRGRAQLLCAGRHGLCGE